MDSCPMRHFAYRSLVSFFGGLVTKSVMIFIDGQNILMGLKNHYNKLRIDYKKLPEKLMESLKKYEGNDIELKRNYFFDSYIEDESYKKKDFYRKLKAIGYQVEEYKCKVTTVGESKDSSIITKIKEKGTDVGISVDMLTLFYRKAYDIAILVSGDSDYKKLIEAMKHEGAKIYIASLDKQIGSEFKFISDRYISIDNFLKDIEYKP